MKSVSKYYEQAELALAAYAVLRPSMSDENNKDADKTALQRASMTRSQAERFSAKYSVVDQFDQDSAGISITVFKDADDNRYLLRNV